MASILELLIWGLILCWMFKTVANIIIDWFVNPIQEFRKKEPLPHFGSKKKDKK